MTVLTRGRDGIAGDLIHYGTVEPAYLNDSVEFDSPFFVIPGDTQRCTILTSPHVPADGPDSPSVTLNDGDGDPELEGLDGWQPVTGYSGQYGYSGPVMHPAEILAGGMERDILNGLLGGGWFVVTSVETETCDDFQVHGQCYPDGGSCPRDCSEEPAGWILLHKPVDLTGTTS